MNDPGDENSSSYCLLLTIKKMTTFHKSLEPPTSVYVRTHPSLKNKQINGMIVKKYIYDFIVSWIFGEILGEADCLSF